MRYLRAYILRDIAIERTYRFNIVVKIAAVLFQITVFYFISRAIAPAYFPFVLVGILFSRFFQFWMSVFGEGIRQEQYWGTAEQVFLAPVASLKNVLSAASGKAVFLFVELVIVLAVAAAVFPVPVRFHPAFMPLVILHAILFSALGVIAASFVMYHKRGDPVGWLLGSLFDLLSGVYFPVAALPVIIQPAARVLPTTAALSCWRAVLLEGRMPSGGDILNGVAWTAALTAVAIVMFRRYFEKARSRGSLGSY